MGLPTDSFLSISHFLKVSKIFNPQTKPSIRSWMSIYHHLSNLIQVYPWKQQCPALPYSKGNLSTSSSPSRSLSGILLLQINTLALLLHLHRPQLLWSSSLPLALHFKLQRFSQNISSLLNTCLYHQTPFTFAIWTTVSFNPNIFIRSSVLFFSKMYLFLVIQTL